MIVSSYMKKPCVQNVQVIVFKQIKAFALAGQALWRYVGTNQNQKETTMTRIAYHLSRLRHEVMLSTAPSRWMMALVVGVTLSQIISHYPARPSVSPEILAALPQNPNELSEADHTLYRMIFAAQERGEFSAADTMISELSNSQLLGHVLANRYLNTAYNASASELRNWLVNYNDHPETTRMVVLAEQKGITNAAAYKTGDTLRGEGYVDHLGRTAMPDSWYRGLRLWREHNYSAAAPIFAKVAADENLSEWQRAAGYYWAFRADSRRGARSSAHSNLAAAAEFKTTFYGLLASRQLGRVAFTANAPSVSSTLRNQPGSIRAGLLASLGRTEDAENELRRLYMGADLDQRAGVVTLASELGLSNLQVRLAKMPQLAADEAMFANYPIPRVMVEAQTAVDPALLLAIARNESSFRVDAKSGSGAVGMMQMMPSTARAVERHASNNGLELASASNTAQPMAERLSDPKMSVRFGAKYVSILMNEPAINGNLVRLLAGYNAGPGAVAAWQSAAKPIDDPLLYVESIPYAETRNYVMQVMAQYWVYQNLLGEDAPTLTAMARGQWPHING